MLNIPSRPTPGRTRRDFLRVGSLGLGGLTLPGLLRARAETPDRPAKDTSVVWLFLSGGPSHIDTYDPKPDAPAEFRGPYRPIRTRVPGLHVSDLLPRQAKVMDRLAVVRTLSHGDGNHGSAVHWVATGVLFPPADLGEPQIAPSPGSVLARTRGVDPRIGMPPYHALSRMPVGDGPAYLGVGFAPFEAQGPARENMSLPAGMTVERVGDRRALSKAFDHLRRDLDAGGTAAALDDVERQAFQLVLGAKAREAYDLGREDRRTVDRYGHGLGEQLLLARRLCEAGAGFVTVEWTGTGKRFGWDNHKDVFPFLDRNVPELDHAVAAFVEDVHQRGQSDRILLVVMGEMGRTPKVNERAGRDHWPQVMFCVLAGGGLKMGQAVGRSSERGEVPVTRPLGARDLLATLYHVLGIDPKTQFAGSGGRPLPVLTDGEPITELV